MAIDNRFEVLKLGEGAKQLCHFTIINTTIVESHAINRTLQELGSPVKALALASTQGVICQSQCISVYMR